MRTEIPIVVIDTQGNAITTASVTIYVRGTLSPTAIYVDATSPSTLSNPRPVDTSGRVTGWIERGAYDAVVTAPGLSSYTEYIDAAPAADGAVDTAWIANSAVTDAKIAGSAGISKSKLGPLGIVSSDVSSISVDKITPSSGMQTGETETWDQTLNAGAGGWARSSGTAKITPASLGTGTPSSATFLRGDGTWAGATGMDYIPIDLRNPSQAGATGNCFPAVSGLTAWEYWHWEFLKDVDGYLYGLVKIPSTTPTAAKVILATSYNATSGVSRWAVNWASVIDGGTFNPSLTNLTAQDITVPATARLRKDVTFAFGSQPAANSFVIVQVVHIGSHVNDTVAVNSELAGAWFLSA